MITKKLLLLGEIGVGKTSLVRRLVHDELPSDYRATMGVDLYRYEVDGIGDGSRRALELVVWDLDGNYGLSIFKHTYSKGASGALIVGDVLRYTTLEHMTELADGFMEAMPSRQFSFVVNKLDLIGEPDATRLPEKLRATRHPMVWTSAMTAHNVLTAFRQVSDAILRREG
ncbi:MAG: Rab family GTPase [Hyphomicrobiaceae bacterium]